MHIGPRHRIAKNVLDLEKYLWSTVSWMFPWGRWWFLVVRELASRMRPSQAIFDGLTTY